MLTFVVFFGEKKRKINSEDKELIRRKISLVFEFQIPREREIQREGVEEEREALKIKNEKPSESKSSSLFLYKFMALVHCSGVLIAH